MTRLEVTFQVEGRIDGPVDPAILEDGTTVEQMADRFARDLKALILDEAEQDGVAIRVNVRASARLHEDEGTGHAAV